MPTVTNTEKNPAGAAHANALVRVRLVAALVGAAPGYVPASDYSIMGEYSARTDSAGVWSVALVANELISPANTYYVADVTPTVGQPIRHEFSVPNGAGPYRVEDILTDPPANLPDLHQLDPIGAHAASAVAFTPAGELASTDTQSALVELEVLKVSLREGPLPASRYVAAGMTEAQRTVALQDWLNAADGVVNPQLRMDERRYDTDDTLVIPPVSGLDIGGLGIVGQPSSVFLDGAGSAIVPPPNVPAFVFEANSPVGAMLPYAQHLHDFVVAYEAPSGTANTDQVPFVYDTGPFHQAWRRIVTINAFKGWDVRGAGAFVWNNDWEFCTAYGTQRNVWDMTGLAGQPMLSWRNCGAFNTNTPVVADGPVWQLSAVLEYLIDADVEGWYQSILTADSSMGRIERLHVEHHRWPTDGFLPALLTIYTGKLSVGNIQVSGVTGGNGLGLTVVASAATADAVVEIESLSNVTINRLDPAVDPGSVGYFYGPGRYRLNHAVAGAGIVPTLTGYNDAATALRVAGFDDSASALRLGNNRERFGSGVPDNAMGANGDWYKRLDGGGAGLTHLYFKTGGAWIAIA